MMLSERVRNLRPSPVREMLAVGQRPDMISFAGGLPAPETFPPLELEDTPRELLQYGPSEGELPLREQIAARLQELGLDCGPDRLLILSGSQQGIDLVAKLTVDRGTRVAVDSPAYLAALQVFRFFGAEFSSLDSVADATPPALAYVTPTFHNPTGACWAKAQREQVARDCRERGVILFEDDPYRDLVFEKCDRTPVCSLMGSGSWIYQGSFSKTSAPGLRLGFLAASPNLFPHLARLKQAADLHTNRLSQWIVLRQLLSADYAARLDAVAATYRAKRDSFADALRRHLGNSAQWDLPKGGMFFWVTLSPAIDTEALLPHAIERGVLFTPGAHFFADGRSSSAMRLNFSLAGAKAAERGLDILGQLTTAGQI